MKKTLTIVSLLLLVTLFAGCSFLPSKSVEQQITTPQKVDVFNYDGLEYKQTEVLVRTAPGFDLGVMMTKQGSEVVKEWPEIGWSVVSVPAGETPLSFIKKLRSQNGIILAEPNLKYELDTASEEIGAVDYDKQWGFDNINAEDAWDITTGSKNVIVAVIDTGVDINHPEFEGKTFIGAFDASGEGTPGVDYDGHGTHVAGTAADDGRTGEVAGVAWDCPIMPIRAENSEGSIYTTYLIEGMIHVGQFVKDNPEYRAVVNMSIGGRGYNFSFKDAIDFAAENGVLLVTSAGNDSKRILSFPSAYSGVVSVAASTPHDTKADFSTIGSWNSVAAPGVRILSTYPTNQGSYAYLQGTSMASPHVAGAAALILSKYPDLTPLQVKNQLEQTANGEGYTEELGYGIIDMKAMLGPVQPMQYGTLNVTTNIISNDTIGFIGTGVITVYDKNDSLVGFGTTGEYGNYLFNGLKPGTYTVNASYYSIFSNDYEILSNTATVSVGGNSTLDFDFTTIPSAIERISKISLDINNEIGIEEVALNVTEAGLYEIQTSQLGDNCDTYLVLLDANGDVVAENDDFGSQYSYIPATLEVGNYTIVVMTFDLADGTVETDILNTHLDVFQTSITY